MKFPKRSKIKLTTPSTHVDPKGGEEKDVKKCVDKRNYYTLTSKAWITRTIIYVMSTIFTIVAVNAFTFEIIYLSEEILNCITSSIKKIIIPLIRITLLIQVALFLHGWLKHSSTSLVHSKPV